MLLDYLREVTSRLPAKPRAIVITVVLGLAGGGLAVLFHYSIQFTYRIGIEALSRASLGAFLLGTFAIVMLSSLAVGWLLTAFCPEAAGSGIPQVKLGFWRDFGASSWRSVWVKFLAGTLSVGGGASLGREGPSVQLASGLAANLGRVLGVPNHLGRASSAAGAASGLAAAFNTPIAAVTFVLEEIVGDLNSRLLGGILFASVLGALVAHALIGSQPSFVLSSHGAPGWIGYALAPLVAALAAFAGGGFQRMALGVRGWNKGLVGLPPWSRVMIGGLVTWLIGVGVFLWTGHLGVFSLGYDDLASALNGDLLWQAAAILLLAKLAATVFCYGFGGCGGVFAPTLFFGGMVGALVSALVSMVLPLTAAEHVAMGVVGMCACLGGVVRAPVTGILIIFEMTHEFSLVPLLIISALVSQAIARRLNPKNFYDDLLEQDGAEIERRMPPRGLTGWMDAPVGRVANFKPIVAESLDAAYLEGLFARHRHERFPLVIEGRLLGVLDRRSFESARRSGAAPAVEPAAICQPDTKLRDLHALLVDCPGHLAVVTDQPGPGGKLVAIMTLHDLLRAELLLAEASAE